MTDSMVHATGAWPNYDPQMAESIVVLADDAGSRKAWVVMWTDTEGVKHGRMWSWETRRLHRAAGDDPYPVVCASTQAGCVWAFIDGDRSWAELQQASGRNVEIPILPFVGNTDAMLALDWEVVSAVQPDGLQVSQGCSQ